MDDEGLRQLTIHGKDRVQRGHGLLENNRNGVAADGVHLVHGQGGQFLALKLDGAGVDVAVAVQQTQDGHGGNRLAGAGLTDDTDGLAGLQGIGHIVYGLDDALFGFEKGLQVLDLK